MASEKKTLLEMLGVPSLAPELKNSAVIIIDAQREYLDGRVPLVGIEAALEEIKKLLALARKLSVPVFHLQHKAPDGAPVFGGDSIYTNIIDSVRPEGKEPVIVKHQPSGFAGTNLDTLLADSGQKSLVIAGFMTHMCVNATARGAAERGFAPTVISSACATRDLPGPSGEILSASAIHSANLASLSDLVACVVPDISVFS